MQTIVDGLGTLALASRLEWLPRAGVAKVPVEVAATGPRVIEAAARHADRICLAVGADPDYVGEKLAHARRAADAASRDPASLRYGAYVTCVLNDDTAAARNAVRGSATTFARFSALPGSRLERLPPLLRRAAEHIRAHYDMRDHTRTGVAHTAGIPDEFVDWFAIRIATPVASPRVHGGRSLRYGAARVLIRQRESWPTRARRSRRSWSPSRQDERPGRPPRPRQR